MGKGREPQIILKTDERKPVLELRARGNSSSSQAVGMKTGSSSMMTSSRSRSRTAAWCSPNCPPSGRHTTSRRTRWCVTVTAQRQSDLVMWHRHARNAVTSDAVRRVHAQKRVGQEKADSLRLLIVVAACGALASPGDLPQILLAHLYPQFAEPAASTLAQRPHSSADVAMVVSLHRGNVHARPFPRRERRKGARGAGLPSAAASRDGHAICSHAFRRTGAPGPALAGRSQAGPSPARRMGCQRLLLGLCGGRVEDLRGYPAAGSTSAEKCVGWD
jgi:hypothetical protein